MAARAWMALLLPLACGSLPVACSLPSAEDASLDLAARRWVVVLRPTTQPAPESPGAFGSPGAALAREVLGAGPERVERTYERVLQGFSLRASEEEITTLREDPRVAYVEEDVPVHALLDTQVSPPWGLDRLDQTERDLDRRYHYENDGAGVHVYLLDSGVRSSHVDFGGRVSLDHDALGGSGVDENGHGTAVASVVAGATFGVAKGARVHSVRVLDGRGDGTLVDLLAGLDWTLAHAERPAVVLLSLGTRRSRCVDEAVARLLEAGLVCVAAAGNQDDHAYTLSPAGTPGVIVVGATSKDDRRWPLSNWGAEVLFAPGVSIPVAGVAHDAHADLRSGTSLAAAHVAGIVARCLQLQPTAGQAVVRDGVLRRNLSLEVVRNVPGGFAPLAYSGFRAGMLERVAGGVVEGWVWDPARPNQALEVSVIARVGEDVERLAVVRADAFRADLAGYGLGNGAHGFRFTIPEEWRGRKGAAISVSVDGAGFRLADARGLDELAVVP